MSAIAFAAISYIASLAGNDEELSAQLLLKLVKAVIGEGEENATRAV